MPKLRLLDRDGPSLSEELYFAREEQRLIEAQRADRKSSHKPDLKLVSGGKGSRGNPQGTPGEHGAAPRGRRQAA